MKLNTPKMEGFYLLLLQPPVFDSEGEVFKCNDKDFVWQTTHGRVMTVNFTIQATHILVLHAHNQRGEACSSQLLHAVLSQIRTFLHHLYQTVTPAWSPTAVTSPSKQESKQNRRHISQFSPTGNLNTNKMEGRKQTKIYRLPGRLSVLRVI